jgi:hypothetical protein
VTKNILDGRLDGQRQKSIPSSPFGERGNNEKGEERYVVMENGYDGRYVAFFSATIDGRNLIFYHKLHIGTPYCGKRFLTCQIPTSCLPKSGWHTYMKLVTKYQIPVINSCLEKCDEKCAYTNVYQMCIKINKKTSIFALILSPMGRTKTKPFLKRKKVPKLYFHFWTYTIQE